VSILGNESIWVGHRMFEGDDGAMLLSAIHDALGANASTLVLITDTSVSKCGHASRISSLLDSADWCERVLTLTVQDGEQSKCRQVKARLEDEMLRASIGRRCAVVAVGGGVVGDLAGFVAATYMRGVPVVQVPTSLLAMVDSSVGGKTGVNTSAGKNLVGAFHQPRLVLIDTAFLDTLPPRHVRNGMAECLKAFAIRSRHMFERIESHASVDALLTASASDASSSSSSTNDAQSERLALLNAIVLESVRIKADVVTEDERESGCRALLNFGHTIGHAVEALCMHTHLHGECVAIGMVREAEVARALGALSSADAARLTRAIAACGLPTELPGGLGVDALLAKMDVDKKTVGASKRCVLLSGIGKTRTRGAEHVDDALLRLVLSRTVAVVPPRAAVPDSAIRVPGSKSISNRVLLLAALGEGDARIEGLLHSEDTQVMVGALEALGVASFWPAGGDDALLVRGNGGRGMRSPPSGEPIYLANAGTASRFLTTLCTLVPVTDDAPPITLTGNERHQERPLADLIDALRDCQRADIRCTRRPGCLPIEVRGAEPLAGGEIRLKADVSSQYVSSVLMSAPYARKPVALRLVGGVVVSEPYIDMTIALMATFGVEVSRERADGELTYRVPLGAYKNPARVLVEADASSATYPLAIGAITGGQVCVELVGDRSLQGDANFVRFIERLGCSVSQCHERTTVHAASGSSPPQLVAVDEINMADMTDAFMTAAALAAVASGTTRIVGIANQRVKECNRIEAMVTELAKCGVHAYELDDGIAIEGQPDASKLHGALIDCRNDHRIAMSFAVLGCRVAGIFVDDRECTKKTYPEFWEHLRRAFRLDFDTAHSTTSRAPASLCPFYANLASGDAQPLPAAAASSSSPSPSAAAIADIVIVGMRGAGKSHQAAAAAKALGASLVDVDVEIERSLGTSIKEHVESDGWASFRRRECETLARVLDNTSDSGGGTLSSLRIVACGGGIVETREVRTLLAERRASGRVIVVHLRRHIDDIARYLSGKGGDERPQFADGIAQVWQRREPLFDEVADVEFSVAPGDSEWPAIERDFVACVRRAINMRRGESSSSSSSLDGGALLWAERPMPSVDDAPSSFFLSLTFADVRDAGAELLGQVSADVHALELRVDLLRSHDVASVREQLALLRRWCPSHAIVFTVRTAAQGGGFDGGDELLLRLVAMAVRAGVEFVDVECVWPTSVRNCIVASARRSGARVIVSEHRYRNEYSDESIDSLLDACAADGDADVVKLVLRASDVADVFQLRAAVARARLDRPHIALATANAGKLSRVLNRYMTPVTHEALPAAAAPGQLSVREIFAARALIGVGQLRAERAAAAAGNRNNLYLFGSSIGASPSPAMHNAAFRALHCDAEHRYALFETSSVESVVECLQRDDVLGGNITMPFKEAVIPSLAWVSDAARRIGAVNTIVKARDGSLRGYNTDWLGIARPIAASLRRAQPSQSPAPSVALVLGAGGTARAALFAMRQLDIEQIYVWNRTHDKAERLAAEFGCTPLADLSALGRAADVVVSTLPPAASGQAERLLDAAIIEPSVTKCVLDVVYTPSTPFLGAIAAAASSSSSSIDLIAGETMIIEQGVVGFAIWSGMPPPIDVMRNAVRQK
jgi:pentafunctional AROM polypeptide